MNRKTLIVAAASCFVLATAAIAFCADIVGTVSDVDNKPVAGVWISVTDTGGKILGAVVTDSQGKYRITGLAPGAYDFVLNPKGTSFQSGNASAYLGNKGLTIDWRVSKGTAAVALAAEGTGNTVLAGDPFGMSSEDFAALLAGGTVFVAGGVVGGYAAAGGFGGAQHPHSPSQ